MKTYRNPLYVVLVGLLAATMACALFPNQTVPPQSNLEATAQVMGTQVSLMETQAAQSTTQEYLDQQWAEVHEQQTQVAEANNVPPTHEPNRAVEPTRQPMPLQLEEPTTEPADVVTTTTQVSATEQVTSTNPMNLTFVVSGTEQVPVTQTVHGAWTYYEFDRLGDNPIIAAWLERLKDPAPDLWKTYPNVPNQDVPDFRVVNGDQVPDGVEYGVANVPFCQQDTRCDFVVPGWHYRLITADYKFLGMECTNTDAENRHGCLLLLINEGNESYTWRDQNADNGFTVAGRYWNGDALEWGVWGLVSHVSANMLNMETYGLLDEVLNAGPNGANAGANCGVQPVACGTVDVTVVVHTGDALVAILKTTVVHP